MVRSVMLAIALALLAGTAGAQTAAATRPCQDPGYRQLDFWVGRWEVYPAGKAVKVADSLIESVYGGCGVRENWMPLHGPTGGSLSSYVLAEHVWKQTWIDASGSHVAFVGGWDGRTMTLTGDWPTPATPPGAHNYVRMMYAPNPDGSVRQWGEASPDMKTWSPAFDFTYRKAGG